jgi:hypothetical protein
MFVKVQSKVRLLKLKNNLFSNHTNKTFKVLSSVVKFRQHIKIVQSKLHFFSYTKSEMYKFGGNVKFITQQQQQFKLQQQLKLKRKNKRKNKKLLSMCKNSVYFKHNLI